MCKAQMATGVGGNVGVRGINWEEGTRAKKMAQSESKEGEKGKTSLCGTPKKIRDDRRML